MIFLFPEVGCQLFLMALFHFEGLLNHLKLIVHSLILRTFHNDDLFLLSDFLLLMDDLSLMLFLTARIIRYFLGEYIYFLLIFLAF